MIGSDEILDALEEIGRVTEDELERLRSLQGVRVHHLAQADIEVFQRACAAGLAYRDYDNPPGFAKVGLK